jgi:glycosyltransferase involved in cell wall biosynthesis
MLMDGEYDIFFVIQDTFHFIQLEGVIKKLQKELESRNMKSFKLIHYFPVDGRQPKEWTTSVINNIDVPVAYTKYAEDEVMKVNPKLKLDVVYHGVNLKYFFPVKKVEREKFKHEFLHGLADSKFLVTNVNSNWLRKDLPRTLEVFSRFHNLEPDSFLYLHTKNNGLFGNIIDIAEQYGLEYGKDFLVPTGPDGNPDTYNENEGFSIEMMNMIYNMSDVIVSTTLGEGWGLSVTEAMAAKVPVVVPNHTSLREICDDGNRGLLVQTSGNVCYGSDDWNRVRPTVDVNDFVAKLKFIKHSPLEVNRIVERAHNWVLNELDWNKIGLKWKEIFSR